MCYKECGKRCRSDSLGSKRRHRRPSWRRRPRHHLQNARADLNSLGSLNYGNAQLATQANKLCCVSVINFESVHMEQAAAAWSCTRPLQEARDPRASTYWRQLHFGPRPPKRRNTCLSLASACFRECMRSATFRIANVNPSV